MRQKPIYSYEAFEKLRDRYLSINEDTEIYTISGGLLGSYIIKLDGYKTAIIKEVYLNEWSSGYNITLYNKTPEKYLQVIDLLLNDEEEKATKLFYN